MSKQQISKYNNNDQQEKYYNISYNKFIDMKTNISRLKSSITNPNKLNYVNGQSSLSSSAEKRSINVTTNPELKKNIGGAGNSLNFQNQQFTSNYQTIFKTVFDEKLSSDKKLLKNYSSQQHEQIHKVGPIKFSRNNHSNNKIIVDQAPIFPNNYQSILNKQKQWKTKKSLSFSKNQNQYELNNESLAFQNSQKQKLQSQMVLQWSRNKEQLKKIQHQFQEHKRLSQQSLQRLNKQNQQLANQLKRQKQQSLKKIVQLQLQLASIPQQVQKPVLVESQVPQAVSYKELGQSFQRKVNDLYDQNYKLKNMISSLQSHISQLQIKNSSLLSTVNAYQQRQTFQLQNNTKSSIQKQIDFLRNQNDKLKDQKNMLISEHELAIMKFQNEIQILKENRNQLQDYQYSNNSSNVSNSIKMEELRILAKDQFADIIQLKREKKILSQKLRQLQIKTK